MFSSSVSEEWIRRDLHISLSVDNRTETFKEEFQRIKDESVNRRPEIADPSEVTASVIHGETFPKLCS